MAWLIPVIAMGLKPCVFETRPVDAGRCPALIFYAPSGRSDAGIVQNTQALKGRQYSSDGHRPS